MQIINWPDFLNLPPSKEKFFSMTIGVFDGVHRGHRALIKRIISHNADYMPVVVTFRFTNREQRNIQSFQQRLVMLKSLGVKMTIIIDFTDKFKQIPGIEFIKILLEQCNVGFFVVGNNFRCGYQLDTDAAAIQNFFAAQNIPVEIVPEVCHPDGFENSLPVSSSRIRAAIAAGDLALAQEMLGY